MNTWFVAIAIAIAGCEAKKEPDDLAFFERGAGAALRATFPKDAASYRAVKTGLLHPTSRRWVAYETIPSSDNDPISRVKRIHCYQGTPWECSTPSVFLHVRLSSGQITLAEPSGVDDSTLLEVLSFLRSEECTFPHDVPLKNITFIRRQGDTYRVTTAIGDRGDIGTNYDLLRDTPGSTCKWKIIRVGSWVS